MALGAAAGALRSPRGLASGVFARGQRSGPACACGRRVAAGDGEVVERRDEDLERERARGLDLSRQHLEPRVALPGEDGPQRAGGRAGDEPNRALDRECLDGARDEARLAEAPEVPEARVVGAELDVREHAAGAKPPAGDPLFLQLLEDQPRQGIVAG